MPPHDHPTPPKGHRKGPPKHHDHHHPPKGHHHPPRGHHPPKGPPKGHHRHVPSSAVNRFVDLGRVEALLAPWLPDPEARAFVVRCMLGEGPAHHRGSSWVLLALLGELARKRGAVSPAPGETTPVPLRLPPHLAEESDDASFPLELPLRPLLRLARPGSPELAAMVDCLTDGPAHHALANAAMVALLDALLEEEG